jgi:hypothetical protein
MREGDLSGAKVTRGAVSFLGRGGRGKSWAAERGWARIGGKGGKMVGYFGLLRDREAAFEAAKELEEAFARFLEEAGLPGGRRPYDLRVLELALMAKGRGVEAWLTLKDDKGQVVDFPLALPGEPLEELLLLRGAGVEQ